VCKGKGLGHNHQVRGKKQKGKTKGKEGGNHRKQGVLGDGKEEGRGFFLTLKAERRGHVKGGKARGGEGENA